MTPAGAAAERSIRTAIWRSTERLKLRYHGRSGAGALHDQDPGGDRGNQKGRRGEYEDPRSGGFLHTSGHQHRDINHLVHENTIKMGGIPAPLNFEGIRRVSAPPSTRWSATVFRIPSRILKEGDIINVDVTTILDGYYGDASRMYCIGNGDAGG